MSQEADELLFIDDHGRCSWPSCQDDAIDAVLDESKDPPETKWFCQRHAEDWRNGVVPPTSGLPLEGE